MAVNLIFLEELNDDISFSNVTFTPAVVYKAIKSCRNNRTLDPHGFSSSLLKNISSSLINPLCILFSHIFDAGVLPNQWKYADITPVFKKVSLHRLIIIGQYL